MLANTLAATSNTALAISKLSKRHGSNLILDSLDLTLAPGEIVSQLGPSGCGKTTLLRCVAGLESLTSGTISMGGRVVAGADEFVPPEQRDIGLVFQSYALWPHLSVFDNVAMGLKVRGVARSAIRDRVDAALSILE